FNESNDSVTRWLGFGMPPSEARDFAEKVSKQLGGDKFEYKTEYTDGNIVTNVLGAGVRLLTVGIVRPGKGRNQNRGIGGFENAARQRWEAGGVSAEEVDAGFKALAEAAYNAQLQRQQEGKDPNFDAQGVPTAAASIVDSLNPNLAEKT